MPSIVTSLIPRHDIVFPSQKIDDLGFAFITPLGSDYNTD
jgi:hypothetical protein